MDAGAAGTGQSVAVHLYPPIRAAVPKVVKGVTRNPAPEGRRAETWGPLHDS